VQGPDGVGLEYMDRQAALVEAILEPYRQSGEITNLMTIVGRWDPNRVYISAPLADWGDRALTQQEIVRAIRGPLKDLPGSIVRIRQHNSLGLSRTGAAIEFALTGTDYGTIAAAADDFLGHMAERLPRLGAADVEFQQTQPQLTVRVDRRRAEDLGVPVEGIVDTLRAMVDGLEVTEINADDRSIPVLLESAAGAIDDPGDLHNLFVRTGGGALVPLSAFVTLEETGIAAELDRAGQRRAVEINANLREGYTLRQAMTDVEGLAREVLPEGIGVRFVNEAATLEETSRQIAITFGLAVLVVLLVLAAQFESLLSALTIVLTVPFGLAAAVFALALTDTSLNIYSQIGLVMLVGLMAKNGILVVEFADQLRDRGLSVGQAIREAAVVRLRPVMMTMLSTVLGALPLILASGAGAEARRAIGWVVFGGLGIATVFTLLLVPVIYSLLAPLAPPRAHAGVRLDRELRAAAAAGGLPDEGTPEATTTPLPRPAAE